MAGNPLQHNSFYPRTFQSAKVITSDANGYPTLIRFYAGPNYDNLVFSYEYTWNTDGQWQTWKTIYPS